MPAWSAIPNRAPTAYEDLLAHVHESVSGIPEFYLLGSSFGGPLALMLAAAVPSRVRGIILAATFVSPPRPQLAAFRPALFGPLVWTVRTARRIPVWLRGREDPLRKAKAETWSRVPAGVLAARARAALGVNLREVLERCKAPILCVSFDEDRVIPAASAAEIQRLCPSARSVTLPGGHLAMFSDPAPLVAAVAGFIRP